MSLAVRLLPCLDLKDGRVVKGIRFQDLRDAGDPVEAAALYEAQGGDELVLLDVSATPEGRAHALETVSSVRAVLSIPMTVGGGVRSSDDAGRLLGAGADKVGVNTAAVRRPELIEEISVKYGAQCTVLAVDAAAAGRSWEVVVESGRARTGQDVVEWCLKAVSLGAGEILLTSWDRDGTRSGYDTDLIMAVSDVVNVPVIASGGANEAVHLIDAVRAGASAVLVASILHDGDTTVTALKRAMSGAGIEVRL
jgi:imidazoleglycerol phosphate synthase cyclase subunit